MEACRDCDVVNMAKPSDQIASEMVAAQSLQLARAIARIEQLTEENGELKRQLAEQQAAKPKRARPPIALAAPNAG